MNTRRDFLRTAATASSALLLSPATKQLLAATASGSPARFVFIRKSSGLRPHDLVPPTLSDTDKETDHKKGPLEIDLENHELPAFMEPVAHLKSDMTILQGLSGKMCSTGHWPFASCVGVFKGTPRAGSYIRATVDFELAKVFPSPFMHVGLSAAKPVSGVQTGLSASAPGKRNYEYCTPNAAYADLFGSVAESPQAKAAYELDRDLLDFAARIQGSKTKSLTGIERRKVATYADAIQALTLRNKKLEAMSSTLKQHAPQLDAKYLSNTMTPSDKQIGHAHVAAAALIAGLTNVVTLNMDDTDTRYEGLDLAMGIVHDWGHGKTLSGVKPEDARDKLRTNHMKAVAVIADQLKAVPEGDGTMFDNTLILYVTDNGETHHSNGVEWPYVLFSGKNVKLDLGGRYLRLPNYGDKGHKTIGNWYTTILNAYGNPIEHYGSLDLGLNKFKLDQTGPIARFIA